MKIIPSQVFNTGTKFVVTKESIDGTFKPGSTGFISYVKGIDRDYPNVVFIRANIVKRGKAGKERLEQCEISTPVFDFESEHLHALLPNEERRHFVHIKSVTVPNNVISFSKIDYLAWANAYARYIHKLSIKAKHVSVWPNGSKNLVNRILHIDDYYREDENYTKDTYCNTDSRVEFIAKIRVISSTLVRCCISYMYKIAQLEEHAILDINKRSTKDKPINTETILKTTKDFFSERKSMIGFLHSEHGKNKNSKTMEIIRNGLSWS